MPRTHRVKVYQFAELDDRAKEKARDWFRQSDAEWFDADEFKDEVLCEHAAYHHRLKTTVCHFSLSYCQGDGVAFYGDLDLDFFVNDPADGDGPPGGGSLVGLRRKIRKLVRDLRKTGADVSVSIGGQYGHYHHWNSMSVTVEAAGGEDRKAARRDELANQLEPLLNEYLTAVSHDTEELGYKELEYRDSAEVVDETITINEYEFTEDGERFVPPGRNKKRKV